MRNETQISRRRPARRLTVSALAFATLGVAGEALAVPCSELNLPNPIYGTGGSAVTATLSKVAALLAGLEEPITVLYSDTLSACPGYYELIKDKITPNRIRYWSAAGVESSCEPSLPTQPADFAHMGNPESACPADQIPTKTFAIGDFPAPIQSLNIITSVNSTENAISAEALFFAFGWGDNSGVAPWTLASHLSGRQPTSFIGLFVSDAFRAHGLTSTQFLGDRFDTQNLLIQDIVANAASNANATLGYVSGSAADAQRKLSTGAQIKTLAYQHFGQTRAYYPDSTADSFDKINVRRGQYHFWAPGHFFAKVDSQGQPTNPRVAELIGWFNATIDGPQGLGIEKIQEAIIKAGDLPVCASEVTREGISGPISSFAPARPCFGFFEQTANGQTSHPACPAGNECSEGQQCRFGFCEDS